MGNLKTIENIVENKLMNLHTAYIAKVLSYSGGKAKIQPMNMVKAYGATAQKQSPLSNVPVLEAARYKYERKTITYVVNEDGDKASTTVLVPTPLAAGDLVFCVCAERDITQAKAGKIALPPVGHHSMSDSVVVGIL